MMNFEYSIETANMLFAVTQDFLPNIRKGTFVSLQIGQGGVLYIVDPEGEDIRTTSVLSVDYDAENGTIVFTTKNHEYRFFVVDDVRNALYAQYLAAMFND